MLCVRIHIEKYQTLLDVGFYKESFSLLIWTQAVALNGVYFFSTALVCSQFLGHFVLHRALTPPDGLRPHYSLISSEQDDNSSVNTNQDVNNPNKLNSKVNSNEPSSLMSSSTGKYSPLITAASFLSFFGLMAGIMMPCIHLEYDFSLRIHKWMIDEEIDIHKISESYSVLRAIAAMGTVNHIGESNVGMSIFTTIFVVLAPIIRSFCCLILWFVPLTPKAQSMYANFISILSVIAQADVFAVTTFIMLWQLPKLFEHMEEAAKYVTLTLTSSSGLYIFLISALIDNVVAPRIYNRYIEIIDEARATEEIPFARVSAVP